MLCLSFPSQAQLATEQAVRDPQRLFAYACGLYRRQFHDMALAEFDRYLASFPEGEQAADSLYYAIDCLDKLKRTEEMLARIRLFLERYPQHKEAEKLSRFAADQLMAAGKYQEAAALFRKLRQSKHGTTQEYATYFLAQCLARQNQPEEAAKLYAELASHVPSVSSTYRYYAIKEHADRLYQAGKLDEALEAYQRLIAAKDIPEQLIETALFNMGEIHLRQKKNAEASRDFGQCVGRFPDGLWSRLARKYRATLTIGAGDFAQGIELAEEWLRRYPDAVDYEVDYNLARAYFQTQRYEQALPYFNRVEVDPKVPSHIRQGAALYSLYCLMMARHLAEAEKKAADFLERYPRSTNKGEVMLMRGNALMNLQRLPEAEAVLKSALDFFADHSQEDFEKAGSYLLRLYHLEKRWAEAAVTLRKMASRPAAKDPMALYLQAADFEVQAGQNDLAREDLGRVLAKGTPEMARQAWRKLAELEIKERNYSAAIQALEKLCENAPVEEYVELEYRIAYIYYYQKRFEEALAALRPILNQPALPSEARLRINVMALRILLDSEQFSEALPGIQELLRMPRDEADAAVEPKLLGDSAAAAVKLACYDEAERLWRWLLSRKDATPQQLAQVRMSLAELVMHSRNRAAEAAELLAPLAASDSSGAVAEDVQSLLAEAYLQAGDHVRALDAASKAYKANDGTPHSHARTLYLLAYLYLNIEKKPDLANKFATQCYILENDSRYSPAAMEISLRCFLALKDRDNAMSVFEELSSKFPVYVSGHPEIRQALGP